tara:strand:- start:1825 stop:2127 length:303 start_codon:yes stop_codon:yes gene_type:complete
MVKYDKVVIKKSTNPKKKLMAVFSSKDSSRTKTTHFGSAGMSDFPTHKDEARKQRYLDRHRKRENWQEPTSAGALARWILWNKTSRRSSISDFKSRFNLK